MALASPAAEYRIPKREIAAEATFLGHPSKVVRLFLNERAQARDGAERLSDLLNAPGEFLPAVEPPRRVVLLSKEALMVLTVAADAEFPPEEMAAGAPAEEAGTSIPVEIVLQDASEICGMVEFVMPEGRSRLVDFLNLPERFFAVRDGIRARLVNKKCVVRISMIDHEPGK